jgi:putative membrane protein
MAMMWGYYMGSGMAWWMIFSSLLWLGIAAVAVWALVRWLSNTRPSDSARSRDLPMQEASAIDILKARYARGEIDTSMFQAMQAELEASDTPASQRPMSTASSRNEMDRQAVGS